MKKNYLITTLIIVSLFLGTWAYIKAEGQQITICVKKNNLVYVVGEDFMQKDCKKADSLLSWNAAGQKGEKGDVGPQGPAGTMSTPIIVTNLITSNENIPTGAKVRAEANCPSGSFILGGGAQVSYDLPNLYQDVKVAISESYPSNSSSWVGVGTVVRGPTASGKITVNTYAVCSN